MHMTLRIFIFPRRCDVSTFTGDVYIVAVTKANSNATLVFQFLYQLAGVFRAYFGGQFDENNVRENFVLIYELLDGKRFRSLAQADEIASLHGSSVLSVHSRQHSHLAALVGSHRNH